MVITPGNRIKKTHFIIVNYFTTILTTSKIFDKLLKREDIRNTVVQGS